MIVAAGLVVIVGFVVGFRMVGITQMWILALSTEEGLSISD